ncbi:MAG: hypothetical protein H6713_40245 [Myxococcales bacterium]|nr:hypothetical protein [Myxococcales bacterium]MCB9756192.1 hypothetical protein [Myxococcales bacterium]
MSPGDPESGRARAPETASPPPHKGWQGPSLRFVFTTLAILAVVLGFGAFRTYSKGLRIISDAMHKFDEDGKTLTADQCISETVDWYMKECSANIIMCESAIRKAMAHCLQAQDRAGECKLLSETGVLDPAHGDALAESREHGVGSGQWVFYTCKARGTECQKRGKCPCADAVRTVDEYCVYNYKASVKS